MPSPVVDEIRALVRKFWQVEDLQQAAEVAEQAVADAPWDGRLWELHGLTRKKLGDLTGATAALETANSLVPLTVTAQCTLADCYLQQGRPETARVILVHVATSTACPTGCLASLAAGLGKLGEFELALKCCRLASERDPGRDEPLYGMAYYMRRLKYPTEMIAGVVAQAQKLDPRSITYRVALAILYAELNRLTEAHALVRPVPVGRLRCRHCLEKLERLFTRVGDDSQSEASRARLIALETNPEGQSWPPSCGPC